MQEHERSLIEMIGKLADVCDSGNEDSALCVCVVCVGVGCVTAESFWNLMKRKNTCWHDFHVYISHHVQLKLDGNRNINNRISVFGRNLCFCCLGLLCFLLIALAK